MLSPLRPANGTDHLKAAAKLHRIVVTQLHAPARAHFANTTQKDTLTVNAGSPAPTWLSELRKIAAVQKRLHYRRCRLSGRTFFANLFRPAIAVPPLLRLPRGYRPHRPAGPLRTLAAWVIFIGSSLLRAAERRKR